MPETDINPEQGRGVEGPIQTVRPPGSSMSGSQWLIVVVIFLLVAFIAGAGYYIWKQGTFPKLPQLAKQKLAKQTPAPSPTRSPMPDQETVTLPISSKDNAVVMAGASMVLQGTVYSVKKTGDNAWELVFRGRGGNIYFDLPFTLTKDTSIVATTEDKFFSPPQNAPKIAPDGLVTDQKILIHYFFDLKQKTGSVTSIVAQKL